MIPSVIREWLGARLSGPPRSSRARRHAACLFCLGRIGDFVLTLSALRMLVREFGATNCVLVVPIPLAILASREFPGVQCITLPTEAASLTRKILPIWWRERNKFSADSFDRLICLSHQRSLYYELALSWIDAGEDIRLLPETYPLTAGDGICTELLAHQRLVEIALGRAVRREEILPRFTSLTAGDDHRLLVYPLSRDPTRSIPTGQAIGVLRRWRERSPAPIIFGGSPAERTALARLAALANATGIPGVFIETPDDLDGLLEQVARAGAVFAADSAVAHIATALDKPSVVMTSSSFYGYAQPWARSERQHIFRHGTSAETVAAALPVL